MSKSFPKIYPIIAAVLFILVMVPAQIINAQTNLLISQYMETPSGTSPKGIEIWNNSGSTLDFSTNNLIVKQGTNGGAPTVRFTLSAGTMADNEVIVIGTSNMEATTLANGSVFHEYSFIFNGDDALEIWYGSTKTDVFGTPGSDPGSAWTGGGVATNNSNIQLLSGITTGDLDGWTDPSTRFETVSTSTDLTGFGLSPITGGETAPAIISTTPSNTETGVAINTNITINFNEAVTITGSWFSISGSASGLHTATVSGGPSAFTLNPDFDLLIGEIITVTIYAAQVTDVDSDDPPDNMNADYIFSFTTSLPIPPPVINELLADPAAGITGDANGDGVRDFSDDEFVEIVNNTGSSVDISGWTLSDFVSIRHTFPSGSVIPDQAAIVVFGGGTPTGDFGYAIVQTASTGALGLNNTGDTVTLNNGTSDVVAYSYGSEGNDNQSLTRDPDITGTDPLIKHSTATGSSGSLFSPGTMIDGSPFPGAPVPPPVINEVHADPAGDLTGDANGDGVRHYGDDEFVEIINNSGVPIDISGWTLADGGSVRHTFPAGTIVPDQSAIVVFGGGTPTGTFGYAIVQNASNGYLGLNNSSDTVTLNNGTSDVVAYTYGSEAVDNQSVTRYPDITGTDPLIKHSTATGSSGSLFSPGTMIDGSPFPGAPVPPPVLEIFDIQGNGLLSPYDGLIITTENNVVTAISSDGFFIQTPTARSDADISTSDGILVYTGSAPTIAVGDLVNVTGKIKEFYDFTEIENVAITIIGTEILPDPVVFDELLPAPNQPVSTIEFERFESMLITIGDGTVTGSNQYFGSDPIAEVYIVAGSDRTYREPGLEFPGNGDPLIPVWDSNPEVFELDPNKLGLTNITIHAGSSFEATGVLGYEYSGYEFWPFELTVDESTLPVAVPDRAEGEYTVGSLNLYRLFQSESDYATRLSKFSMYIREILNAPDILAVQEVENLGALEDLAAKILLDDGSVIYDAYLEEGNDIGGIDVGFLVRSDRVQVDAVTQLGATETYVDPSDLSVDILHDRPPLLLEGSFIVGPTTFYSIAVMAVHNRSLNSIETLRVQTKRLTQAQSIAEKIQGLQVANPNVHLVVTGDFNAFEFTDGYVDAVGHIIGDFDPDESVLSGIDLVEPNLTNQVLGLLPEDRYSFVYQGNAQVLDHALTSVGLDQAITGFAYGRGNADAAVNYLSNGATPLRSSDHDGLVLYIDVTLEIIFNDPINLWPANHKYTTFDISDIVSTVTEYGEELPIESVYIQKVTSDEPDDADGNGDGKTVDDIVIVDCQTVKLRAEREGTGNGRVYTVYLAVENANGYIGYGTYQIGVPHDMKDTAIDDGAAYEVLSDCETQDGLGKILDNSGTENVSDINAIPNEFVLNQNYPNPFNPITTINYQLPEPSSVTITIYDISGCKVRELINGSETAGYKSVMWNGRNDNGQIVSGGIYIYHLKAGNYSSSQKMILMK